MTTIRNQTGEELFFEKNDQSKAPKEGNNLETPEDKESPQPDHTDRNE